MPLEDRDRPELPSAEEMRRRRIEVLGPYANMEMGRAPHPRDKKRPFLKPALDEVPRQYYTDINWRNPWVWLASAFGGGCYGLLIWLVVKALTGEF